MHHVAIMKKSWGLIPKILLGEKTIESRWYQTKRAPWNTILAGDTVFFKNAGEKLTAQADVSRVLQFTLSGIGDARAIVRKYGKKICLVNSNPAQWDTTPRYCILIFIHHPRPIPKPFSINKTGFGSAAAWLTVQNINCIKSKS